MGIFDNNISPFHLPAPIGKIDSVNIFDKIQGKELLFYSEALALKDFCQRSLLGDGLFALIPTLMERNVTIEISNKIRIWSQSDSDTLINPYATKKRIIILGEYLFDKENNNDQITLYISNIRMAAKDFKGKCKNVFWDLLLPPKCKVEATDLLLAVLTHELYHAFFHKDSSVRDAEEPLAEFGSLLYMSKYFEDIGEKSWRQKVLGLCRMIRQKEGELENYSRGAKLFLRSCLDDGDKIIGLIEKYKSSNSLGAKSIVDIIKEYSLKSA